MKNIAVLCIIIIWPFYFLNAQNIEWMTSGSGRGNTAVILNGNQQQGSSIVEKNGNVYVAGLITSEEGSAIIQSMEIAPVHYSGFLAKYDNQGNILWVKLLPAASPNFVAADELENIYVVGWNEPTTHALHLQKYNTSGDLVWEQPLLVNTLNPVANSISVDSQANIIIGGRYTAVADSFSVADTLITDMNGNAMGFMLKYDSDGNFRWFRSTNTTMTDSYNECTINGIDIGQNDDIYFTGQAKLIEDDTLWFGNEHYLTYQNKGLSDAMVGKIDKAGKFQWIRQLSGQYDEAGNQVRADHQGNVYFTGWFSGELIVDSLLIEGDGKNDFFAGKLTEDNHLEWIRTAGSSQNEVGSAIDIDAQGNIYFAGRLNVQTIFYSKADSIHISDFRGNSSDEVHFLAKYNTQGKLDWIIHANDRSSSILDIFINKDGSRLYFTGFFSPGTTFGDQTIPLAHTTIDNFMVGALEITSVTGLPDQVKTNDSILIYPNPSEGVINMIATPTMQGSWECNLYNAQGSIVICKNATLSKEKEILDFSNLSAGIYTLVMRQHEKRIIRRVSIK